MRIEKSVTSITWIPSEAIKGMPKMPFEMGVAHYDPPPPDKLEDLEVLRQADAFREANELRAWAEFEDGEASGHGYSGGGHLGVTRIKLLRREFAFPAVQYPLIQADPEVGDGWVKFTQSAGGHMGLPAPRRVRSKPFFRIKSASAWTTLSLTIKSDGSYEHSVEGASPFPRHWIYDDDGNLKAFLIGGPSPGTFAVRRSDDFDISDCALLPGGDLLLLERRYSLMRGVAMRIRRIPLASVKPGALVDGPILVFSDMGYEIDNMEGLSVHRTPAGDTVLTLVSDDNFSPIQRTILLQFTLVEE